MSPADTVLGLRLLHLIQTRQLTPNQAYFAIVSFMNSYPPAFKFALYRFLSSLPIPQLPVVVIIVLVLISPLLGLLLIYGVLRLGIWTGGKLIHVIGVKLLKDSREKTFLELTFPQDTSKSAYATEQVYNTMHTIAAQKNGIFSLRKDFSLEIVSCREEGIRYIIGVPTGDATLIHQLLLSYLPGLKVTELPDYLKSLAEQVQSKIPEGKQAKENNNLTVISMKLSDDFVLPLQSQATLGKHDSMAFLTGTMTKLAKEEMIVFQLVIRPMVSRTVKKHIKSIKNTIYQGKPLSPLLIKNKVFSFPLFSILVLVLSPIIWLTVAVFKLILALPSLVLDPNGSKANAYFKPSMDPLMSTYSNPYEQELATRVKEKLASVLFETQIRVLIQTNSNNESKKRQTGILSSFNQFTNQYQSLVQDKGISLPLFRSYFHKKRLTTFFNRTLTHDTLILSSSELSDLYHFPNMDITQIEGMHKSKSNQLPVPTSMKRDDEDLDIFVGKNTFGGEDLAVGLKKKDRGQHTYIVGKTGMGKSTIIETMALQDIQNGKGVCVIDPHGDMALHLLSLIPKHRKNDVVYLNPFDKAFPTGLNIFRAGKGIQDREEAHRQIAGTIMAIFKKITPEKHWGQRMEHILRNAILTTLLIPEGTPETPYISLYTLQKLVTDATYRKLVIPKISDPILRQYWEKEFTLFGKYQQGDMISPLTNRIGEFITDPLTRNMLLQESSSIDIADIMHEGKILLVNLSKGTLGEERSAFFGTVITSLIQLATYARATIPIQDRKEFFVYIDEFQNFATPHFTELFSESRKYHVYFTPSHQSIAQIDDPKVLDIIKGNSGTIIALKGGPDDEKVLLPFFTPEVKEGQIVNLSPHHFFMKVTNDENEDAFTGVTVPIANPGSDAIRDYCVSYSQNHYATPRSIVEQQVRDLLGAPTPRSKMSQKPVDKNPSSPKNPPKKDALHAKIKVV